jgi:hypothetical protein
VSAVLGILQHALGVDQYGRGRRYRSHFVTGEGSTDYPSCMEAVERGLMTRHDGSQMTGGDFLFTVTRAGDRFVTENSPAPPKLTRSQKRYREWLNADCGGTFAEWIGTGRKREEPNLW